MIDTLLDIDKAIYTNPKNFSSLKGLIGNVRSVSYDDSFIEYSLDGIPIYIDHNLPEASPIGKVKFPTDGNWKFCEFEEKDEEWALALGVATREEEPVYYMIDHSKIKVSWDIPNLKLDWSIEDKQINRMIEKMKQDIENKFNEDMMRACTQTILYGAV